MVNPTERDQRDAAEDAFLHNLALAVLRDGFANEGLSWANTYEGKLWLAFVGLTPDSLEGATNV